MVQEVRKVKLEVKPDHRHASQQTKHNHGPHLFIVVDVDVEFLIFIIRSIYIKCTLFAKVFVHNFDAQNEHKQFEEYIQSESYTKGDFSFRSSKDFP